MKKQDSLLKKQRPKRFLKRLADAFSGDKDDITVTNNTDSLRKYIPIDSIVTVSQNLRTEIDDSRENLREKVSIQSNRLWRNNQTLNAKIDQIIRDYEQEELSVSLHEIKKQQAIRQQAVYVLGCIAAAAVILALAFLIIIGRDLTRSHRYRKELYLLGGLFVFSFILVTISLLRTHRRSLMERKNLQMLEEAHKRLTLSMNGGKISLWNIQEGVLEFDDNYVRLVGMEQRRFTKEDIMRYTHPDDVQLLSSFYETLYQSPSMQIQRIRFCFGGKEADYQWYELRCSTLKDAQGEIMLAGIMQNIQNLVEHEQQLILAKQIAEKAELKQSFLNNMSHEIRTPLNAIVGFTNLLIGEGADEIEPEEKAAMIEIVNNNNELLLKLVNDVLEISRLDSGNLSFDIKEHNITKIIKEIYVTYQTLIQPSLCFILELDETVSLPVNIDCFRFTQVISNFLNNANKFTKDGTITLGCKIYKEHQEVCVYVKDTGKGIDDKELMMIFDRFYKTDEFEQGSGLGLSICKVIIERLAGRIEVHSEVGKGSCFSVILSLANII